MVINPIVGVYIPIIRIPIKGWMTIPNTRSLDPGTYLILFGPIRCQCGQSKSLHALLWRKRPILLGVPRWPGKSYLPMAPWCLKRQPWKQWKFLHGALGFFLDAKEIQSWQTHLFLLIRWLKLERRFKLMVRVFQCFHIFHRFFGYCSCFLVRSFSADWSGLLRSSQFVGRALGDHPTWRALPGWKGSDSSTYCI